MEMKDIVKKVEAFDVQKEKIRILNNRECKFKYRDSIFIYSLKVI